MKHRIKCKCLIDLCEWEALPQNLLNGHGCPTCSANEASKRCLKSHVDFVKDVHNTSPTISILNTYKNNKANIKCQCGICSNIWETAASNLIAGKGCPICGLNKRINAITKTHERFIVEMDKISPNIEIIGTYINSFTQIECKCRIDGYKWKAMPSNLLHGTGCPICLNSHGEQEITKALNKMSIYYIPQYKFDKCRNIRCLPFDFYLPRLNLCLEYDGQQHFRPVNFGGCTDEQALKSFKSTKENDSIKNQYCIDNGIKLVRIKYSDFNNIQNIIQKINFS